MCARYTLRTTAQTVLDLFEVAISDPEFHDAPGNIAPTDRGPIIVENSDGARELRTARWGLVPFWAKDASGAARLINARSETIFEKPAFREAILKRRCLVPADGFYEWAPGEEANLFGEAVPRKGRVRKQPYRFGLPDDGLYAIAGLYEKWRQPTGETLTTYTVITCDPNALIRPIHDRMPVILAPDRWAGWLARENQDMDWIAEAMGPYPEGEMASNWVHQDEPFRLPG